MKNILSFLMVLCACSVMAQGPIQRNRFTTNTDGALINGSMITNLNASSISSGTVATNVLPGSLPTLANQIIIVSNSAQLYAWDGNTNHASTGAILQTNAIVEVLPGNYYVPALPMATGVQLIGIGFPSIYHTNVTSTNECDLLTMGPFLQPNHNCRIIGLNVVATNGWGPLGYYDAPIGLSDGEISMSLTNAGFNSITNSTNVFVQNCNFTGMSDSLYWYFTLQDATNSVTCDNCVFNTMWDAGYINEKSTNSYNNFVFKNCTRNVFANTNITGNGWNGSARGLVMARPGVFVTDIGGQFNIYGTNIGTVFAIGVATGSAVGPIANVVGTRVNFPLGTNVAFQYFLPHSAGANIFGTYYDNYGNLNSIGSNYVNAISVIATGFATQNTNQYTIAGTGWTNTNAFDCVAYTTMSSATYTYSRDGVHPTETGTGISPTGLSIPLLMMPGGYVTATSGLGGTAVPK